MSGIEKLTDAERYDLAERVHSAVEQFKRLRASPLWSVQTFRVSDVASELTRKQATWFAGLIAFHMRFAFTGRVVTEEEILELPVDMPDDLQAGSNEFYTLMVDYDFLRRDKPLPVGSPPVIESLNIVKLKFCTVERPQVAA